MCGRYVSTTSPERIAEYFDATIETAPLAPSYNVAPTDDVYGISASDAESQRALRTYRWGLVPSWAKDAGAGARMINARAETLATSTAFKRSLASKRLLIPMDGFYEWRVVPSPQGGRSAKQPVYFHRRGGEPFAVAGLWAAWKDRDDEDAHWLHSCTIITTQPNALAATVHDRMPAILPKKAWSAWLDPKNDDLPALQAMLRPAPESLLVAEEVAPSVNNVRNNGPDLITPLNTA